MSYRWRTRRFTGHSILRLVARTETLANTRLKLTDPPWHAPGGCNRTARVHYLRPTLSTEPAARGRRGLYANTRYKAKSVAIDPATGRVLWGPRPGGIRALDDGVIYASKGSRLFAIDAENGKVLWKSSLEKPCTRPSSDPVLFGGQLVFPTGREILWGKPEVPGRLCSVDVKAGAE